MKKLIFLTSLCFITIFTKAQDNSNLLLGNPSNAKAVKDSIQNFLLNRIYFVESYNSVKNEPNWVAWHLDTTLAGDVTTTIRLNNFHYDAQLPYDWYRVEPSDYKNSGFDRGHNCPSDDRGQIKEANAVTFLMSNMIPQAPRNNETTWENLEKWIRARIHSENLEAYITMGSYGKGGIGKKGYVELIKGKINVPRRIWKIIVFLPVGDSDLSRINSDTEVIAVDTPNEQKIDTDWTHYIVSVSDLEKSTHYHFFTSLNFKLAQNLKQKKFVPHN